MRTKKDDYDCQELIFIKPVKKIGYEINQKCNLRCKYCWDKSFQSNKEIDINGLQFFLNQILKSQKLFWPDIIPTLSCYAAEPLLSWNILKEIIKMPFFHSVLTNGTLLTTEQINILKFYNVNMLFSLDGIQKNHDYYRDKSYDKVLTNILKYDDYEKINVSMTININSLPYLYESLELLFSLPIGRYDNWNENLFNDYMNILIAFISKYINKNTLPNYSLKNRFSNLANAKEYQKDRGGPLMGIDVNGQIIIQKPFRSCLFYPQPNNYFYGTPFANFYNFLNSQLKKDYEKFMLEEYKNYNYINKNCSMCQFEKICNKNNLHKIIIQEKECYPIKETLILEELFWNTNNLIL